MSSGNPARRSTSAWMSPSSTQPPFQMTSVSATSSDEDPCRGRPARRPGLVGEPLANIIERWRVGQTMCADRSARSSLSQGFREPPVRWQSLSDVVLREQAPRPAGAGTMRQYSEYFDRRDPSTFLLHQSKASSRPAKTVLPVRKQSTRQLGNS